MTPFFSNKRRLMNQLLTILTLICLMSLNTTAQIQVNTDRAEANYEVGDTVRFEIIAPFSGTASYTIIYDSHSPAITSGTLSITANATAIIDYVHNEPGVVLCEVELNGQTGIGAAAFDIHNIVPLEPAQSDFDAFWNGMKAYLATVPLDPVITDCDTNYLRNNLPN